MIEFFAVGTGVVATSEEHQIDTPALVLPLNGVTTGIGNFVTFSEIDFNFRVTPQIMALGVAFAMVLGALGGLFPASSASRKEILTALRGI